MSESESQFSAMENISIQIESCLLKALRAAETVLSEEQISKIRIKVEEISNSQTLLDSIDFFLFTLINELHHNKQAIHINVDKEDYKNLEVAVQKSQAEVRKHIRLEQQLKIYMDGLEQKIQALEKELQVETKKYFKLFQSMKVLDLEKKQLKKKIKVYESKQKDPNEKEGKYRSQKGSKILSEPSIFESQTSAYKVYHEKIHISRGKRIIEKSSDHSKNLRNDKIRALDEDIHISLDENLQFKNEVSADLKQMTKTIHLKENSKKLSRKILKFNTDQKKMSEKKQVRCNSVCR